MEFGTKKLTNNFAQSYQYLGKSLVKDIGIRSYKYGGVFLIVKNFWM